MTDLTKLDDARHTPPREYEKPRLEPFPDYVDMTLQQSIIIPGPGSTGDILGWDE